MKLLNIAEISPVWAIAIPAAVTILGFIINYFITKNSYKKELEKHKNTKVYEKKVDAIYKSLEFIDLFLSWSTIDDGSLIPARENTSINDITLKARSCYNLLSTTCDSVDIINCFINIIDSTFSNEKNIGDTKVIITKEEKEKRTSALYNKFRKLARIELGLKNDIPFDKNRVFLAKLTTPDLQKIVE